MKAVLDASALLAYLQDEPGSETIEPAISSVNWAEVVQKSLAGGVDVDGLREDVEALGLHDRKPHRRYYEFKLQYTPSITRSDGGR